MAIRYLAPALLLCVLLAGCAPGPQRPMASDSEAISPCLAAGDDAKPGVVVGIGEGTSLREARQRAYAHISEQLEVEVRGETTARVNREDGRTEQDFQQRVRSYTEAQLSETELACLDQQSQPGRVFAAYHYDQRALPARVTDRLVGALERTPARIQWQGPAALKHAPLLHRINRELQRRAGNGQASVEVELFRQEEQDNWGLRLGDELITLEPAQLQVAVNWRELRAGETSLAFVSLDGDLLNRHVAAGTEYRLALKHPRGGYAQLLGIYENGRIDVLRENLPLPAGEAKVVPGNGGVFEAARLNGASTTDTWLLLATDEPLQASQLPSLYRRSDAGRLQSLMEELADFGGDVATEQLVIE